MSPVPDTYRAWTWVGGAAPMDLLLADVPRAALAPGEVWVQNAAIGLNPVDWKVLDGKLVDWQPGKVPGVDGAGVVVAAGEGVDIAWVGKRVSYHQNLARPGSFAEFTPLASEVLVRVPDDLDLAIAAGVPCPALTAWIALEKIPAKPGESVLVAGAGGAVGNYLVQFAAARGFHVTAMASPRHHARLASRGATRTVAGQEVAPEPSSLLGGERYFAALDAVSGDHARSLVPLIKANGHLVCIQDRLDAPIWPPFGPAISLHEVALGAMHAFGDSRGWADLMCAGERIMLDIASRRLLPEALLTRDFSRLPEALASLRDRSFTGKIVVSLEDVAK